MESRNTMTQRRESIAFALVLAALLVALLAESLLGGKLLDSSDVLFVGAAFEEIKGMDYEPKNRLQIDPVLQFQPWLAFNRESIREGRLPLWNHLAGCGAPHLANAQSAPFDPFHVIAYLGELPDAYAWMAFARLWVAGIGVFFLARFWKFGAWGRWFSGLVFPLSGFLIVWLSFPVTSVAVWLPWLFLTTGRVIESPSPRRAAQLGIVVGFTLLAGHIQTSAHALLAAGLYGLWQLHASVESSKLAAIKSGLLGLTLGFGIGAITIFPLWDYLGKSPVWNSRKAEFRSAFHLDRPRLLDAACTAVPYAFGSQRGDHPNLAKAFGVHNLNESAGGFVGLATLIWLAPQAWLARRSATVVKFLWPLTAFGGLAAFAISPFSNLLRLVPILDVTDHRRLTLWVAFGLAMLGGIGLDHLREPWPPWLRRLWLSAAICSAIACLAVAAAIAGSETTLERKSIAHYQAAYERSHDAHLSDYRARAANQVRKTLAFVPRQFCESATEFLALAILAGYLIARPQSIAYIRPTLVAITMVELFHFAYNLNPALERNEHLPTTAVIEYLKAEVGDRGRSLGIGEELVPNTLMRYGLADIRNYDSVELAQSLDAFPALFEAEKRGITSRNTIRWNNVIESRRELEEAGVLAVVAATPPPDCFRGRVDKVGSTWIARLDGRPLIQAESRRDVIQSATYQEPMHIVVSSNRDETILIRFNFDSGFQTTLDGRPWNISTYQGRFMKVDVPPGRHELTLTYRPASARWGLATSLAAAAISLSCLTFRADFLSKWLGRLGAVRVESIS